MAVGVISYNHTEKKLVFAPEPILDSFRTQVSATTNGKDIYPADCKALTQNLLVTNDTVLLVQPNDSLAQPLMGKPFDLVNNNRTLVARGAIGDVFSLTYFFDQADSTGVSPILIIKRSDRNQVIFLSHTTECDKLVKYLKGN